MENIIQSQGKIDAVFAQNDEMALGASKALADANMKDVLVVGFDATDDAVDAVKKGDMAATVAQQPILIGETAVKEANKYLQGEKVKDFVPVKLQLVTK
ncbi:substrate-binding domain-containing protein [Paraclostridium sp. AKS81]